MLVCGGKCGGGAGSSSTYVHCFVDMGCSKYLSNAALSIVMPIGHVTPQGGGGEYK